MLEDQVACSLQINSLVTVQNNHVNYVSLVNHDNLSMI
jgi:hypothetical protein